MKKKFIVIVVVLVLTIAVAIGIFFLLKHDKEPSIEPELKDIVIICNDISIGVNQSKIKLSYQIVNESNLEFSKNISISNNNIILDEQEYIIPQKVGETTVTIKLTTKTKTFSKSVKVQVNQSNLNASFKIYKATTEVSKLFVGEKYLLCMNVSETVNYDYEIFTSENVKEFNFNKFENNCYYFDFTVDTFGKVEFEFSYRDYETSYGLNCYNYINLITTNFDRCFDGNIIKLYLLDLNYQSEASDDNIFNSCCFEILDQEGCLNNYDIKIDNTNVATVLNNNIEAKNEGECNLIISSLDGSNYSKSYKIIVQKALVSSVYFEQTNLQINLGQTVDLNAKYSPLYAFKQITYSCISDYVNIENNIAIFLNVGEYQIIATDSFSNLSNFLTVKVIDNNLPKYSFELTFNQTFLESNNASFEDNILTINSGLELNEIYFSYKIECEEKIDNISVNITFENSNFVYEQVDTLNNAIIINLSGKGEVDVILTLKENSKIYYAFKIVVN